MVTQLGFPYQVPYGCPPKEGYESETVDLDFSVANSIDVDLSVQQGKGNFSAVQTVYVNNSQNASPVNITMTQTNQVIVAPPQSCGYYNLLQPTPPRLNFTSAGGVLVRVQCMNFYLPGVVWSAISLNGT